MNRSFITLVIIVLLVFSLLPAQLSAQENKRSNSELTIPWDEFKKLINLDEDEIIISLETFQKLMAQTGVTVVPQHTLRGGNVVLKREEFKNLINRMKPPDVEGVKPPFDYLITKAVYSGKMNKQSTDITAEFNVHVLKKDTYLKVPVLYQNIALSEIQVNGKPALVVGENGYHNVILSAKGEYKVTAFFSIKSSLDKGPNKIDLSIIQTPITLLNLEMPKKNLDVEIPEAQQIVSKEAGNKTVVTAVIAQRNSISVRWRDKLAITEKIPPKLYSEVYHLVSIEDDALKLNSDINFNILHSEIDGVEFLIPDNLNVLAVSGEGVGEWQEITKDDRRIIRVPFTYGKKGYVTVRVSAETPLTETGLSNVFTGFETIGTVREIGFIGIELNTSAEVIITESEGLDETAIQKLPAQLVNKSVKPLIHAFKYLKHPFSLVLDVKKHEKIGVPVAAISSANVVSLFTEDGKIVHRLVYQVRNSAKQFLEITLPENSDVWSVFVDNQPVESSLNGKGKLLVPLIRSRSVENRLDEFPVEVIYNMSADNFAYVGSLESSLPAVDLLVSQLIWSVYLPNDYSYLYFTSTLEKEEMIRGINLFSATRREYEETPSYAPNDLGDMDEARELVQKKDYKSSFRQNALKEEDMVNQVASELQFAQRLDKIASEGAGYPTVSGGIGTGVMPIHIEVPTSGQVYRFAKSIIKPDDELTFSVIYAQMWTEDVVKWVLIILIVLIIYLSRNKLKRPWNWFATKVKNSREFYKKNEYTINRYASSVYTPFVLFALIIIFWNISFMITSVLFILLVVSIIFHVSNFFKRKKREREIWNKALAEEEAKIGKKNIKEEKIELEDLEEDKIEEKKKDKRKKEEKDKKDDKKDGDDTEKDKLGE